MVNVKVGKAGNAAVTVEVPEDDEDQITIGEIIALAGMNADGGKIRTVKGTVDEEDLWDAGITTISISAPKIDAGAEVKIGKAGMTPVTVTVDDEDSGAITYGEVLMLADVTADDGKIRTVKGTVDEDAFWTSDVLTVSISAPKIDAGQ